MLDHVLKMCKEKPSFRMTHIYRKDCFCLWQDVRVCYLIHMGNWLLFLSFVPYVSILMSTLLCGCSHSMSQPQFWNVLQGLFFFFENPNFNAYPSSLWELQNPFLISKSLHCCFWVDEYLQKRWLHVLAFSSELLFSMEYWVQPLMFLLLRCLE